MMHREIVDRMARAYWTWLTPYGGRVGESYDTDPNAWQCREAAQIMYSALPPGHVVPGVASEEAA